MVKVSTHVWFHLNKYDYFISLISCISPSKLLYIICEFFMLAEDGDTSSGSDSPNDESEEENIRSKKPAGEKSN